MNDFLEIVVNYPDQMEMFENIKASVVQTNDYTVLGTHCYICGQLGHISVDCPDFIAIEGNMRNVVLERIREHNLRKKA